MTFVKKGVRHKCTKRYKKEIRWNKWVLNIYLNESVFDVDVIIWMIICFYVISCVRLIYGKPLARSINHSPTFVTVNTHKSTVSICINFYTILFHLPFLFSNDHRYACLVKIRFLLLPLWKKVFSFSTLTTLSSISFVLSSTHWKYNILLQSLKGWNWTYSKMYIDIN